MSALGRFGRIGRELPILLPEDEVWQTGAGTTTSGVRTHELSWFDSSPVQQEREMLEFVRESRLPQPEKFSDAIIKEPGR